MRIATLLARHGTEKYAEAEEELDRFFGRNLAGVERTVLIVDNALPLGFVERRNALKVVIGGDNSSWEFSAWDTALRFLGEEIWSYDLIHLVTSAFNTLYTSHLDRFDIRMLQSIVGRPVCIGHIDCYNHPVSIQSFRSQHWIRSSFLFMPPVEIKLLRTLVSITKRLDFFAPGTVEPFAADAPLSDKYKQYILDWLTGGDIGQGTTWHSKFALDEHSRAFFQDKATAILDEHLLAIRLRAQGTRLIDTTWLASQLKRTTADEIDWSRWWRKQLAERETDQLILAQE